MGGSLWGDQRGVRVGTINIPFHFSLHPLSVSYLLDPLTIPFNSLPTLKNGIFLLPNELQRPLVRQ